MLNFSIGTVIWHSIEDALTVVNGDGNNFFLICLNNSDVFFFTP